MEKKQRKTPEEATEQEAPPLEETPEEQCTHEEELTQQLQRLQAEFDNYRKRIAREEEAARQRLTDQILKDLLPVLDNFHHALEHDAGEELVKGLRLIRDQLLGILEEHGVEQIPIDGRFDPQLHEAIATVEGDEPGAIAATYQRGYTRNDRILRPAKVSVTK